MRLHWFRAVRFAAYSLCLTVALAAADKSDPPDEVKTRLPAIASVYPQGWTAGIKVPVTILGEYLDRTQSVIFLDPSIRGRVVDSSFTRLALEFDVDPKASLGPHYFRVVSPRGASNLLLFHVGDQPHVLEQEPNSRLDEAQEVAIPATVNGRLDLDGDFDFFRFHIPRKGDAWIFDLRSARNGNGLDPALILLDSKGRKLAHSEDAFIWDPFLAYTFEEPGDYYAVVQPTHVRLDPNFAYQLDIRKAPHLETISPISIEPGATVEATLFGAGLLGAGKLWFDVAGFSGEILEMRGTTARVKIHAAESAADGPRTLAVVTTGGSSNPAQFLVDSTPRHKGGEELRIPTAITGTARYRQPERFSFDVKENDKLIFEVRAQRFGSPVDSILRILDDKGEEIAVNDDGAFAGVQFNKDSRIAQTFKKAGRYQVEIRNLWKTTGEDFPYELLVRAPKPEAGLMLSTDHPYLYPGETGKLKVTLDRRDGFDGPVEIEVAGLPAGISADPVEIAAGSKDGEVLLHCSAVPAGTYGQVVVKGKGTGPARQSVKISSGGGEGATYATVQEATLAVVEKPQFSLEAAVTTLDLVKGGMAEFAVGIKRAENFESPIRFSFENLPPGVTAENLTAAGTDSSVIIRLKASDETPAGRYTRVAILGTAAKGGQVQEAPKVGITIN
jgi:hypothetical protein